MFSTFCCMHDKISYFCNMIELAYHIDRLLATHDCVIIPGFGGFIANYQPARIVRDGRTFLPPGRTIGFNPELTVNDGILIQSYMMRYGISYPLAEKKVDIAVVKMKRELELSGSVTIEGIGCLQKNISGEIKFTASKEAWPSVDMFGLSRFEIDKAAEIETKSLSVADAEESRPIIAAKRNIWRLAGSYAAAAVVAVAVYFMASLPVNDFSEERFDDYAAIMPKAVLNTLSADVASDIDVLSGNDICNAPAEKTVAETVPEEMSAAAPEAAMEQPVAGYHIVVASVVKEEDARRAAEMLRAQGFGSASYKKSKTNSRIIIASYSSYEEALVELRKVRTMEQFGDAWLLSD